MILFGKRLYEKRKENGLTQKQLADRVGLTKTSISCYESGTRKPSLGTLIDLANELNVELSYFLCNDDFVIAEDDVSYGINLAKDELEFILELRKHESLYNKFLENPKRFIDLIEKKIR